MKNSLFVAPALFAGVLLTSTAASWAVPIVYSVTDTASGTLGGTAFTNSQVTVSFASDTSTITGGDQFYLTHTGTGSVTIGSNAPVTLTDVGNVEFFVNQNFGGTGYAGIGDGPSILDTGATVFQSYTGTTAVASTAGAVFYNSGTSFATTAGAFIINSAGATSTFTATSVPEPASLAAVAIAGTAGLSRRRRR